MDELSEEDKLTVARARKIERFLAQPLHRRRSVHQLAGHASSASRTPSAPSRAIVDGEYDHLPERRSTMVGTIEDAVEKGKKLAAEAA